MRDRFLRGTPLLLLMAFALIAPGAAAASTYRWQVESSGNWNDPANWIVVTGPAGVGYPNLPGDEAVFHATLPNSRTITIPDTVTITIGRLTLDMAAGASLDIVRTGTGLLVFDNAGEDARIESTGSNTTSRTLFAGAELRANLIVNGKIALGPLSESGGVRHVTVLAGDVTFGAQPNTYTGTTTVTGGTLMLSSADAIRIPGSLVVGDGVGASDTAVVIVDGDAINHASDAIVRRDGTLSLSGGPGPSLDVQLDELSVQGGTVTVFSNFTRLTLSSLTMEGGMLAHVSPNTEIVLLGSLTATSNAENAARIFTINTPPSGHLTLTQAAQELVIADGPGLDDLVVSVPIHGAGAGVRKQGAGVAVFSADNIYTGTTTIAGGTLRVDGSQPASAVAVEGGTLAGTGTVGVITATSGVIAPGGTSGAAVGTLHSGALTLSATTTFAVDAPSGLAADRLEVTGAATLNNAVLLVNAPLTLPRDAAFIFLTNDGSEPIAGTFAGAPQSATITTASGAEFVISYAEGTSGNDAQLLNVTPLYYYLSEGATGAFFDEDLVIANPNSVAVNADVTFFLPGGGTVHETYSVTPFGKTTIKVRDVPLLENTTPSVRVWSPDRWPLAVERTMFWDQTRYGGHTANAAPALSRQWLFAEGAQGFFQTYLLLVNPSTTATTATVTFLREGDPPVTDTIPLAPQSRFTVDAGSYAALADRSFGITVDSPEPIGAERAMYFASVPGRVWTGGHGNGGNAAANTSWFHPEGASGTFFTTFILMSNPQDADAQVTLRFLLPNTSSFEVTKTIPARQRLTINPAAENIPELQNASFATVVTSDVPIVSERAMYWPGDDIAFGEGHASSGLTDTALSWVLGEGRVGGANQFTTYILLANPQGPQADVKVTYLRDDSQPPLVKNYTVPANSRFNIDVGGIVQELQNTSFGALIEVTNNVPIAVERSMYWNAEGRFWAGGSNALASIMPR